ncbi:DNA methyltransferase [Tsukamurella pseudospumae]|uniref:DNA methyltransferase n=1 Tax=Tsukamurella pseudospumae TaxID=239498 RepID=UPI002F918087
MGDEFVSEHFFTTDAKSQSFQAKVLERRKQWDEAKADGASTARSRYSEARGRLGGVLNGLAEAADAETLDQLYGDLRTILGYDNGVRWESRRYGGADEGTGPVIGFRTRGLTGPEPFVLIEAQGGLELEDLLAKNEKTLLRGFHTDSDEIGSVARLLSHLFVSDDGPRFALVLAGGTALVTERERWLEGRYLAVDLQLIGDRNDDKRGGEIDRALACIEADSLAPDADGDIWWSGVLDESVKHTVGVSKDLREGVRLSIEIIANEVVARRKAQGLPPLPDDQAQVLAGQSLRFLYRVLFLLYAEATPELGVLPAGDPTYERGYSLDRLRELLPVSITNQVAKSNTYFYDSLSVLFELVDSGHDGGAADNPEAYAEGLVFQPLRADLFRPEAISHISDVKLGDEQLQKVLQLLLQTKEKRGQERGYVSYAELGINQLGAVYEGLMSYTGFFAHEDLYEVAKHGDPKDGSWVVPEARIESIDTKDFVRAPDANGELQPVIHSRGSFVFRLAGRERQQSASYYTPEVLTRFTVGQALEELLDQDGTTTTADEILELSVCEPAMGSGAFAIEAVRQLAEQYLKRKQDELRERIDPENYAVELQRVKSYIALHNVYGVDLNATAVEFAEITLWLDTMGPGLAAPWFGLHLRRGNSLIGARHTVIPAGQVTERGYLEATPVDVPLTDGLANHHNAVHHFLLPTTGWGSTVDAKEAKNLAPETTAKLKDWRKTFRKKLTQAQVRRVRDLAIRTDVLWGFALRRLQIAESEIRRDIPLWGRNFTPTGGAVSREQIEDSLADQNGAYRRLRRVMDAWCALWFWPLTDGDRTVNGAIVEPPSLDEWIDTLTDLLGTIPKSGKFEKFGQGNLYDVSTWSELTDAEESDLLFAQAKPVEGALAAHPWLVVAERIAQRQGFFHWELDFAPVFARGGFDLQVGNPPWVRPRSDVDALLAEGDPWFQLAVKPTQTQVKEKRAAALALPGVEDLVLDGTADIAATAAFVGDARMFPHLAGLQPDLYRCFMEQVWRCSSPRGMSVLIHLESHFTDEKAGGLRRATYRRLRRHWQFINELLLFEEIEDHKTYGINVYGLEREPRFAHAVSLYHPDTILRSYSHNGDGPEPGIKDPRGDWDQRPHAGRLVNVTESTLEDWSEILDDSGASTDCTPMVYTVNNSVAQVLSALSDAPRMGSLPLQFSAGWHEKSDRMKGRFDAAWGIPSSWDDAILQGPHISVSTPLVKTPNTTMRNNQDWSATDFEALDATLIPATAYQPVGNREVYDAQYTSWSVVGADYIGHLVRARSCYRAAWRVMAANTGERTLIPAIIPPGAAHVDGIFALAVPQLSPLTLATIIATLSSLTADFAVRAAPKSAIRSGVARRLPFVHRTPIQDELSLRALRLNCVTGAYAPLWNSCFDTKRILSSWAGGFEHRRRKPLDNVGPEWTPDTPLRIAADRRQALVEIDALVALGLGITADELCTVYRTQFPVLYGYDRNKYLYDMNGRLVPQEVLVRWRKKGDDLTEEERTATNASGNTYTYELPFQFLDREKDMREAYAEFERRLAEKGEL